MVMEADPESAKGGGLSDYQGPDPIKIEPVAMEGEERSESPTLDMVSSAAAAMLKLSSSTPSGLPAEGYYPLPKLEYEYENERKPVVSTSTVASYSGDSDHGKSLASVSSKIVRKQREFTPDARKDSHYWMKRAKNNEAAKRSREKRRMNDMVMAQQIRELQESNSLLKEELTAIKRRFGLPTDQRFVDSNAQTSECPATTNSQSFLPVPPVPAPGERGMGSSWSPCGPGQEPASVSAAPTPSHMPALIPVAVLNQGTGFGMNSQPHLSGMLSQHLQQHPTSQLPYHCASNAQDAPADMSLSFEPGIPQENGKPNNTPNFHTGVKPQQLGRPISPDSLDSSPGSLTISFSAASSGAESDTESPSKCRGPSYSKAPLISSCPTSAVHTSPIYVPGTMIRPDRSRERKGIPHKLRHKEQFMNWDSTVSDAEEHVLAMPAQPSNGYLAPGEAITPAYAPEPSAYAPEPSPNIVGRSHTDGEESQSSVDSYSQNKSTGERLKDNKYCERRRKNNMAARKCRENRRTLNEMRLAKSLFLETENHKLKDELRNLSDEVHNLKDWLEKKNQARAKGEPFEPPVLEPSLPLNIDTPSFTHEHPGSAGEENENSGTS